ncbi:hypothetical protein FACS189425_10230 [Clostridia bacterium]|nr:hypothetical protein FACS189425_10230 [Clostridia bacterium]
MDSFAVMLAVLVAGCAVGARYLSARLDIPQSAKVTLIPVPTLALANVAVPVVMPGLSEFTMPASVGAVDSVAVVLPSYTLSAATCAPFHVNWRFATCAEYTVVIAPV